MIVFSKRKNTEKHYYFIVVLTFLSLLWIKLYTNDVYFRYKDNFDYSQMGREIKEGKGFKTLQIFPGYLVYLKNKGLLNGEWPNLYRFPLPTLSNAIFQILFDPLKAGIIQSGFWFFLTVILIYYLIYDETKKFFLAMFGSVLFFLDHLIYSFSGLGETLTSFLFTLLIFVFFFAGLKERTKFIVSGFVLGLLFLSRTTFLYLFPIFLVFFILKKYKLKLILLFSLSLFFTILPWSLRNYRITGNPFFSFSNVRNIMLPFAKVDPVLKLNMENDLKKILIKKRFLIIKIFKKNVNEFYKKLYNLAKPFSLFVLFLFLFLFFKRNSNKIKELFIFIFISYFLNYIIYSFFKLYPRYFFSFKTLFIILFFIAFSEIMFEAKYKKLTALILIILALFPAAALSLKNLEYFKNIEKVYSINFLYENRDLFKKIIKNDSVIVSNISHATALFLKRKSIRLPYEPESILKIDKDFINVDFIIIDKSKKSHLNIKYRKYKNLLNSQTFLGNFIRIDIFKYEDLIIYKKRK